MDRRFRVLVVDDAPDFAAIVARYLELHGYQVWVCNSGANALGAIMEFDPCVVLLDLAMPGMDGLVVARHIRELNAGRFLLIAMSGHGREEDIATCRQAGFDHHLLKPFDMQRVLQLIRAEEDKCPGD